MATDQKWPLKSCLLLMPFTKVLHMVNGTLLNFGKRYEDDVKANFWSVAKVALRFGCAKQSKKLERYLILTWYNYLDPCKFSWLCFLFVLTVLQLSLCKKSVLINAI